MQEFCISTAYRSGTIRNVSFHFLCDIDSFLKSLFSDLSPLNSDLSNSLTNLSLTNTTQLQEQRERETLRSHYNTPAPSEEPLTAPTPARAAAPPPSPAPGIWSPEMGIKFAANNDTPSTSSGDSGNSKYPNAGALVSGGKWDGTRGIRFG